MPTSQRISAEEIHTAIESLAKAISSRHPPSDKLLLLGIANGGILLAQRLSALLPHSRLGTLDISFHRDDIARNPIPKEFAPTQIPSDVNGATVIIVDDVLFSGRTVKAALDELFDHGRPAKAELAVLVDRGGRRLPVSPDFCGLTLKATDRQKITVTLDAVDPTRDSIRLERSPESH